MKTTTHLSLREIFDLVCRTRPGTTVGMTTAGVYVKSGDRWEAVACVMVNGMIAVTAGVVPAINNPAFETLVVEKREVCV